MIPRHTPTLYSHPKQDVYDGESQDWRHRHKSHTPGSTVGASTTFSQQPSSSISIHPDVYSQFIKRYRSSGSDEWEDFRSDPDTHYFRRGLGQLADGGESDDEDPSKQPHSGPDALDFLESESTEAASEEEKNRLNWQMYFASVLRGDVLRSEKTRIADALESSTDDSNNRLNFWLGIRAKVHGCSVEEEKQVLEEKRVRHVDRVVEEILQFRVEDGVGTTVALNSVTGILRRLDNVLSLYPTLRAFYLDRPTLNENVFQARLDALNTWSNVLASLRRHIEVLRRWTGSQTLDVTQPSTSEEIFIGNNGFTGSMGRSNTDGPSFVERIMKEESMQRMFEKGSLLITHTLVATARDAQVNLASFFVEMNLPTFDAELVPLISFSPNLAQACLRLRLNYVHKLKDPELLIVDQSIDDLKLNIGLVCTIKRQYESFLAPDPDSKWNLPRCISDDYDSTILNAVVTFFRLIHWKLKSGARGSYFKETEILEAQMANLSDVSLTIAGGSRLIAEQLCLLTYRLMVRVINYFETQVRVPEPKESRSVSSTRAMSDEQKAAWYRKILDNVRLRYRKLQRFARVLTHRFSNSAEYNLEGINLEQFIECLVATNHFLVYTHTYEEEGVYIVASSSLFDRPDDIRQILTESYHVGPDDTRLPTGYSPDCEYPRYLLVLSPRNHFLWPLQTGRMMLLDLPKLNLEPKDDRVRLIADGPENQLAFAQQVFSNIFMVVDENGDPLEMNGGPLTCLHPQQAHLPSVNRELRKITRATARLAVSIVDSVHHVRSSMSMTSMECQDLMENWYQFAADHGQHAQQKFFNPSPSSNVDNRMIMNSNSNRSSIIRFNRMLNKLAISWVTFICDDCPPNAQKTFRWAVNALEFAFQRTKRDILQLPDEQFQMLRHKVGICVALLMGHFDILGARSSLEAMREKERQLLQEELQGLRMEDNTIAEAEEDIDGGESGGMVGATDLLPDVAAKKFWERVSRALREVDGQRAAIGKEFRALGRVLDTERSVADRSLVSLASSKSSVAIRWQQGRFIGAGTFGSVYQAVNLDSGTLMAVKEINLFHEVSTLPNLVEQIQDELSVMELLHHPNIVEYYGIEVHRDKVYIFEEYCQGGSLAALLEHGRIEDERIIQVYVMQMLEGLAYLHSRGIVHRDIKPESELLFIADAQMTFVKTLRLDILLDHLGVIKFADFGAAKILVKNRRTMAKSRRAPESSKASDEPVGMNSLTGTPMYMSPEIIKNDNKGKHGAMDIWSIGCVALEFATGKTPWSHLDNECSFFAQRAIMFHIGVATQPPPLPEPGQLSSMGIDFIKQCLQIDANRRPTAAELIEHPWMVDFRLALQSYEEEEEQEVERLPPEDNFENATVAYNAALIKEKEIEEVAKPSPSPSAVFELEETDIPPMEEPQ
ncbi:kinase [Marasmius fiardii PR-910]|nr:kinase [Marasmius fiardii PR-910]